MSKWIGQKETNTLDLLERALGVFFFFVVDAFCPVSLFFFVVLCPSIVRPLSYEPPVFLYSFTTTLFFLLLLPYSLRQTSKRAHHQWSFSLFPFPFPFPFLLPLPFLDRLAKSSSRSAKRCVGSSLSMKFHCSSLGLFFLLSVEGYDDGEGVSVSAYL